MLTPCIAEGIHWTSYGITWIIVLELTNLSIHPQGLLVLTEGWWDLFELVARYIEIQILYL